MVSRDKITRNYIGRVGFFIVGEPKSGTTALAHFLAQHPSVSMPSHKEPHFFCTDSILESDRFHGKQLYFHVRNHKQYNALFSEDNKLKGDASTGYLYSKSAAENIHKYNPRAKIIIMLRNPIDFLHSLHTQYVNESTENIIDFQEALAAEKKRKEDWADLSNNVRCPSYLYYSERIKYAEQIKRYIKLFVRDQLLILTHEEFKNDNDKTYKKVLEFLELNNNFKPNFTTIHASKTPRSVIVNRIIHNPYLKTTLYKILGSGAYTALHKQVNKLLLVPEVREKIPTDLRRKLSKKFAHEVEKTNKLLDYDYGSLWKIKYQQTSFN